MDAQADGGAATDPSRPVARRVRAGLGLATLPSAPGRRSLGLTFVRHIDVDYEVCVERLVGRMQPAATGSVAVGRSLVTLPGTTVADPGTTDADTDTDTDLDLTDLGAGRLHLDVLLSRGLLLPRLPMDLEVVPWSPAFGTVLELHPARGVRPDKGYYREGHAVLDRLTAVIVGAPGQVHTG